MPVWSSVSARQTRVLPTASSWSFHHIGVSKCRFSKQDGHDSQDPKQSTADMTAFVQNLLQQMQSRFQTMSDSIVTKIDDMGNRINELEQSINELREEIGVEGSPSPSDPAKPNEEELIKE